MSVLLGWHMSGDTLTDGTALPADGVVLSLPDGEQARMCSVGYHYCRKALAVFGYGNPGGSFCRVRVDGVQFGYDKGVSRTREILWRVPADPVVRSFARTCALDVIRLWDPEPEVVRFLETGIAGGDIGVPFHRSTGRAFRPSESLATNAAGFAVKALGGNPNLMAWDAMNLSKAALQRASMPQVIYEERLVAMLREARDAA